MDDESSSFLLGGKEAKKSDFKLRKIQQNRSANALFCGVVFGFIFSFLFAYSGVLDENNAMDFSIYDTLMATKTNTTAVLPESVNLAEYLRGQVRVLCVVMTSEGALKERGDIILDTWGKRCNKILFFSEKQVANFTNIVIVKPGDGTEKMREAFKYVYTNHIKDFDWIIKTNDHSFLVLENLRHLFYQYEPDWPVVIGQRFLAEDYMPGVCGISKRSFTRLVEDGFVNNSICSINGHDEDKTLGVCFKNLNIIKVDSVDSKGRLMFFANNPEDALFPEKKSDYDKWYYHKVKQGLENCCSDRLAVIQNAHNSHLYYLEYFIYKVHAFGRHRNPEPLPPKLSLDEIVNTNF